MFCLTRRRYHDVEYALFMRYEPLKATLMRAKRNRGFKRNRSRTQLSPNLSFHISQESDMRMILSRIGHTPCNSNIMAHGPNSAPQPSNLRTCSSKQGMNFNAEVKTSYMLMIHTRGVCDVPPLPRRCSVRHVKYVHIWNATM